jgi:hypothetical protein
MKRITHLLSALFVLAVVCLPSANAQQQTTPPADTQAPPSGSQGQGSAQKEPASPVLGVVPTITGGLAPNVGDAGGTQSQIKAGVQYSELFDSNFQNSNGTAGWNAISTFGGHFDLQRSGANTALLFSYSGGAFIDPKDSTLDSSYHQFQTSETLQFRKLTLQFVDSFSYLPQSSFGFGGGGYGGSPFLGITILNPSFVPSQGILSTAANRLSNSVLAQASYASSQRTAWTFAGSYGLLHFTSPGFLNSADYGFSAGYNYQLTARDVIGASFLFDATRFSPALASINNSTINLNYGRHISDALMFQVGIGPQLSQFNPVGVPTTGVLVAWNLNTGLSYLHGRTRTNVSYLHGVTEGGGVLLGATTDTVAVGVTHPFGTYTTVTGSFGVAGNTALPQAGAVANGYTSEFATIGITRKLGQEFSISATYNLTRQTTNGTPCVTAVCGPQVLRHQIFIGFGWDMRPKPLR